MNYNNLFETEKIGCGGVIAAILIAIALIFFEIAVAYWCWNGIVVPYFHAPELGYWTIFGLKIMISCFLPSNILPSSKD